MFNFRELHEGALVIALSAVLMGRMALRIRASRASMLDDHPKECSDWKKLLCVARFGITVQPEKNLT